MSAIFEKIWSWLFVAAGVVIASFVVFRKVKKSGADTERMKQLERGAKLEGEVVDIKAEAAAEEVKRTEVVGAKKIEISEQAVEDIKNAPTDAEADALLTEAQKRWPKP